MSALEQLEARASLVHWRDEQDRSEFFEEEARRLAAGLDAALARVAELEAAIDEYLRPSSRRRNPNRLLTVRQASGGRTATDAAGGGHGGPEAP